MESQRPLLLLTLIFLGFLIWSAWQKEQAPKPVQTIVTNSGEVITTGGENTGSTATTANDIPAASTASASNASDVNAATQQAGSAVTTGVVRIKTDVLELLVSTKGGDVIQTDLLTYPVSLEEKDKPVSIQDRQGKGYVAQSGLVHNKITGLDTANFAPNHHANYTVTQKEFQMEGDTLVVPMTWDSGNGITVTKRYKFKRGSFLIDVEHEVANNSGQIWSGKEYRQLKRGPAQTQGGFLGVQSYTGTAYYDTAEEKYEKLSFGDIQEDAEENLNLNRVISGGWAAMLEHYFLSAWIPPQEQNTYYTKYLPPAGQSKPGYILGVQSPVKEIASGASDTFTTQLYIGPKIQKDLEEISKGLELAVDYGIFTIFSKPIFWVMDKIHSAVGNWGWTIILMTLLIKILFFYPSAMSYKSMAKMKKLAPRVKEINEQYKNDPQGKQKAIMKIYSTEKVNPLGGCLPMLIQIPVFMGLYWVLLESVELRQAPWMLWYQDLSIMDPYFILPLIMGASMWYQQKLNPPQMDEMQKKIFQFLPVVFTVMFLFFPAGLVLYWVVNNILSIAQQWYINKKVIGD